jgi:uncharacterized membrane protein
MNAPLHPILVHFTIALTSASLAFDVAARLFRVPSLADAGWWTIAGAAVITLFTIVTGVMSRLHLPVEEGQARSYLRAHMALGPFFFGLLLALAIWRADAWDDHRSTSAWYLASLAITIAVMTLQGYLGGELAYRFGMDVKGRYPSLPVTDGQCNPR